MDNFLKRPLQEIGGIFEEAAARLDLMPYIVEKDFWVCWVLEKIYSISEFSANIIFKGGTSLSKAYGLIDRFSEDIDLTINKSIFGSVNYLEENISSKEIGRRVTALINITQRYIAEDFFPVLFNKIESSLDKRLKWDLTIDQDKQTLLFYYPQLLNNFLNTEYEKQSHQQDNQESYIRPVIRLELGARGGIVPQERKIIQAYVIDIFPNLFEREFILIPTLAVERTFWEKVTILHSIYHRSQAGKRIGHRMSRHQYDIHMMQKKGIASSALMKANLLGEVIRNNMIFFRDARAGYNTCELGHLRLRPADGLLTELKQDYRKMEIMIIGDYPSFEEVMLTIQALEEQLNV